MLAMHELRAYLETLVCANTTSSEEAMWEKKKIDWDVCHLLWNIENLEEKTDERRYYETSTS